MCFVDEDPRGFCEPAARAKRGCESVLNTLFTLIHTHPFKRPSPLNVDTRVRNQDTAHDGAEQGGSDTANDGSRESGECHVESNVAYGVCSVCSGAKPPVSQRIANGPRTHGARKVSSGSIPENRTDPCIVSTELAHLAEIGQQTGEDRCSANHTHDGHQRARDEK